jgi:hypothetical protein
VEKLKVPSYQRAYAWEEEQLKQFISDMLEMEGRRDYYYGHFILENIINSNDKNYEIIDGQQRITTLILFLMVCKLYMNNEFLDTYINKFETVDYDKKYLKLIQEGIKDSEKNWDFSSFGIYETDNYTLSIQRILFALNFFKKLFQDNKMLQKNKIDSYIETFMNASISTHITKSKAIAVQIFELQNSRGVKLNLIEKVKAKLMKGIYLNADSENKDEIICKIQDNFSKIYHLEELASISSFRGGLLLEDILLHHLRVVDDGFKIQIMDTNNDKNIFNIPSKYGNKEDLILNYLDKSINEKSQVDVVNYIVNLSSRFQMSVELVSSYLPELDKKNHLIGDVLILDKDFSLEFFILLHHKRFQVNIEQMEFIRIWERLLFTRDFHDKYYQQKFRDDFEKMFYEIAKCSDSISLLSLLNTYGQEGFRKDKMENSNLLDTVNSYIDNNKENILKNAFNWWNKKMIYILYKYELKNGANCNQLRKIMKEGCSVEHILPQEWSWDWIGENLNTPSNEGKEFNNKISDVINGVGNLLLVTGSENSSLGNKHPKDKIYKSCSGGTYNNHNENSELWSDNKNWEKLIRERGNNIYDFLKQFIS